MTFFMYDVWQLDCFNLFRNLYKCSGEISPQHPAREHFITVKEINSLIKSTFLLMYSCSRDGGRYSRSDYSYQKIT